MKTIDGFVTAVNEQTVLKWIEDKGIELKNINEASVGKFETLLQRRGFQWERNFASHSWNVLINRILSNIETHDLTCLTYLQSYDNSLVIRLYKKKVE